MDRSVKLEASLACANFKNLENDIRQLEEAKIDYLHVDIMDGRFVPNFALDFTIMEATRELTRIPMECHLMIEEPERYIEKTAKSGAEFISFHCEATHHVQKVLRQIRDRGAKAGLALNPATPLSALSYVLDDLDLILIMTVNPGFAGQKLVPATIGKIADTRKLLDESGHSDLELQVDGNVSFANIPMMIKSGASMLVGGTSSVFHKSYTIAEAVTTVRGLISSVTA